MSSETETSTATKEGTPCWIEIPARDIQKLKTFYSGVFPAWEWKASTEEYPDARLAGFQIGKGLSGGIIKMPEDCGANSQVLGSGFTLYFFVDNIEKAEARVHELGGKTVMGKTPEGTNGFFMNLTDVEGNRFGIFEVTGGM